jgi:hypothetical protein
VSSVADEAPQDDVLDECAGALTGVYQPGELAALRDEWD